MDNDLLTAFPPVVGENPKILILGSMPGVMSLQQQQYYAHPRNAFWPIMRELFSIDISSGYLSKIQELSASKVALWDVARQCAREGSLDTAIQESTVIVNDFATFLSQYPGISHIYFNGGKSAQLFRRRVQGCLKEIGELLTLTQLPSTSPANARYSLEQKIRAWEVIKQGLEAE